MTAVHVQVDGPSDAPPVLLVHGFSSSLRSWDLVVPLLADRFRVLRVDLLGHGRTGGAGVDAPAQAVAVAGVLARHDVRDVTVVGHSFGADVAVELAERCDRIGRTVIVAQAPDYTGANLPRAGVVTTGRRSTPVLYRGARPVFGVLAAVLARRRRTGGTADFAAQGLRDLRALDPAMFRIVLVDRRDRMAARPLDEQVAAAGVPTLVVLGGRDHFYGDRSAPRYRAAGATVTVLAGSGHAMPVQCPGETAAFIGTFAAGTAGRAGSADCYGQPT